MNKFTTYRYADGTTYSARNQIDGVLIDPKLPKNFDYTPNEERPKSHEKWWKFPFIVTETVEQIDAFYNERTDEYAEEGRESWASHRDKWLATFPNGTFSVRCLDGGAWDRSTGWGNFSSIEEALACAKTGRREAAIITGRDKTSTSTSTGETA